MNSKYVVDASCILAMVKEETGHKKLYKYISYSIISSVNVAEIVTTLNQIDYSSDDIKQVLNRVVPKIIAFDDIQALSCGMLRKQTKEYGLSLGDRACISLGILNNLPIVTADRIWEKLNIDNAKIILIR